MPYLLQLALPPLDELLLELLLGRVEARLPRAREGGALALAAALLVALRDERLRPELRDLRSHRPHRSHLRYDRIVVTFLLVMGCCAGCLHGTSRLCSRSRGRGGSI